MVAPPVSARTEARVQPTAAGRHPQQSAQQLVGCQPKWTPQHGLPGHTSIKLTVQSTQQSAQWVPENGLLGARECRPSGIDTMHCGLYTTNHSWVVCAGWSDLRDVPTVRHYVVRDHVPAHARHHFNPLSSPPLLSERGADRIFHPRKHVQQRADRRERSRQQIAMLHHQVQLHPSHSGTAVASTACPRPSRTCQCPAQQISFSVFRCVPTAPIAFFSLPLVR